MMSAALRQGSPPATTLSLLGLTPLLAACATLPSGLLMGLCYLALLLASATTLAVFRPAASADQYLIYVLLSAAAWTSILDLALQAWCYPLRETMGIYPLILALNTTLLCRLEDRDLLRPIGKGLAACLKMGLEASALFVAVGLTRELLGNGSILTDIQLLPWFQGQAWAQPVRLLPAGIELFNTPAGALFSLGLLLAALRWVGARAAQP